MIFSDETSVREETCIEAHVRDSSSIYSLLEIERKEGVYIVVLFHLV